MTKKIIIGSLLLVLALLMTTSILQLAKKKDDKKAIAVKHVNSYVVDGVKEKEISFVFYFTERNMYNLKDTLSSVYISNEDEMVKLALKIISVSKTGLEHPYEKKLYYSYRYVFSIPVIRNDFLLNKAFINLIAQGDSLKMEIGSFNIIYDNDLGEDKDITINTLEGVQENIIYNTLKTLKLTIKNKTSLPVIIKEIWLDEDVLLDAQYINNIPEDYSLMGEYALISFNEEIEASEEKILEVPLKYQTARVFQQGIIKIKYEYNGENKFYCMDSFCYFSDGYKIPTLKDVINIYGLN